MNGRKPLNWVVKKCWTTSLYTVESYAWTVCNYLSARVELDASGHLVEDSSGRLVENPLRKIVAGDQAAIIKLAKEMGLTPRARLEIDALAEKVKNLKLKWTLSLTQ